MNNDELKKKIMEILHRDFITREVTPVYVGEDGKEKIMPQKLCNVFNNLTEQALIPYFADALIAAGIGDVKEAEIKLAEMIQSFTRMETLYKIKSEEVEIKKHRAEVAERALDKATELAYEYRTEADTLSCSSCPMFEEIFPKCSERGLYVECSKRWKETLIEQAEKDLSEEGK